MTGIAEQIMENIVTACIAADVDTGIIEEVDGCIGPSLTGMDRIYEFSLVVQDSLKEIKEQEEELNYDDLISLFQITSEIISEFVEMYDLKGTGAYLDYVEECKYI